MDGAAGRGATGELPESSEPFFIAPQQPVILRAARVELPEESPDPVLLPSITLLERAASRGSDPEGLPLPPPHMLAGSTG